MAHGVSEALGESNSVVKIVPGKQSQQQQRSQQGPQQRTVMGSRRIFPPAFKVKVLDSYRNDEDCKLNQRATARKFNIHRRQIQKWLQNEKTLRDSCQSCTDSSSNSCNTSAACSGVATPAASPPQDQPLLLQHQQQHHHHHQQQPAEPTPASPALNLSLARLHGDDLAAQPPSQQQQQPPPPPLAQQQSSAAQALASAAATHQQQQQQPDYRFQVSPTAAIALAAAAGYPDFTADLSMRQPVVVPQQHNFASAVRPVVNYPPLDLYGPLVYQPPRDPPQQPLLPYDQQLHHQSRYHPQQHQQQSHFPATFEQQLSSSSSSSSASPSLHSEDEQQQQRRASLIPSADIKIEPASPDYPATPSPCETTANANASADSQNFTKVPVASRPYPHGLKREHPDEDEHYNRYQSASSLSNSCSPAPSHPDHLESLPLSPARSSASSDSDMEQNPNNGTDLARRRSFSLRFKLEVLDAFHRDKEVAGNQRATARKFDINRRQVQKWLLQENELRGVIEMCGSDSRQRLGPLQENEDSSAVDLSPSQYIDSSLTPPYSTPGCSLSCCQETSTVTPQQPYYCYSPGDLESLKRPVCTQSCCVPAPTKKLCTEESRKIPKDEPEPEQESPLCLVIPKCISENEQSSVQTTVISSVPPSPPSAPVQPAASKKDAILFKPYLDNPVRKPGSHNSVNNNCQNACNLNEQRSNGSNLELELSSFKIPVNYRTSQQLLPHPSYLEIPPVRSAFIRYPSSVHYS